MMTVEQCRAARALLGWSAQDLADEAGVGVATIRRFEGGNPVNDGSVAAMTKALTAAGIIVISENEASTAGGVGVRLAN